MLRNGPAPGLRRPPQRSCLGLTPFRHLGGGRPQRVTHYALLVIIDEPAKPGQARLAIRQRPRSSPASPLEHGILDHRRGPDFESG
jgi:hypothetical protein